MAVAIVTDSAASLPSELAAEAGVTVVPMWLNLGGRSYRDGELALDELLSRLDEGVSTSGPAPGDFAAALAPADGPDGVLVLTISRAMSGTYEAARVAAGMAGERARVVDTGTAAGGQGLVVLAAARAAATGAALDEVERVAAEAAAAVRLVSTLDDLDRLAKSGRVPGAAAWAGRWLGLNPIFEFRGGRARPLRPARGRAAALERLIEILGRSVIPGRPGRRLHVAALHAQAVEPARCLLDAVSREAAPATAFVASFSPVMVVHTGPGLVGLAWWWEDAPPS